MNDYTLSMPITPPAAPNSRCICIFLIHFSYNNIKMRKTMQFDGRAEYKIKNIFY